VATRQGLEGAAVRWHDDNRAMPAMPVPVDHQSIAADVHRVPQPFQAFAVRSEEHRHAYAARAAYGQVHAVRTAFLDAASLVRLAADGYGRVTVKAFSDIDYAPTSLRELAAAAPDVGDWLGCMAAALQLSGVLGPDPARYRDCVASRIDYLASRGAGFHNDVSRHWSACLFWILAIDVTDVEFVMPHAGVHLPLSAGDLLVFDPAMAHGLCRPADRGAALPTSFDGSDASRQLFLTGEIPLSDAQWAARGAPWLPVEEHERRAALDLVVAEFDERSGAIQRLRALRDGMKRSTCHADATAG
jgi:hypothetical protein